MKRVLIQAMLVLASVQLLNAQQPARMARIGYLIASTPEAATQNVEAFKQGLRELGYIEGKTFVLEFRFGEAKPERLVELARELVNLKMDVIVTAADVSVAAVKRHTQTIPIVIPNSADPLGTGFVASLARPGGNVTGLSTISVDLSAKRLELLKEALPKISRVAFVWDPEVPSHTLQYKETEVAANSLVLQIQHVEVRRSDDLQAALSAVTKMRAEALTMAWPNPVLFANRPHLASFAQRNRLPSMFGQKEFVDAGGLMSYGPHLPDLYRRAARYVDRILKGAKPADLPIEQPTKFELVINSKTAKQIGLTIPPNVLARADKVIK